MDEKITMSTKELERVRVIEQVMRKELKQIDAAAQLHICTRQLRRLLKIYKSDGAKGLVHQSRGKPSHRKIPSEEIDRITELVQEKYHDFGPTFALEKLQEIDGVSSLKVERLRQAMIAAGIWSAKRRKKAQVHQLRERRSREGELVQIDGSPHHWFENRAPECCLLVFADDATGKLLWLQLCESESTQSYLQAVQGYVTLYGRPLALYSDKHSVFRVNKAADGMENESTGITQFGRAMTQLGIETIFANTPQAKGRVENRNGTLQDRLVKELRLRTISTITDANKYLPEFTTRFNQQFAVVPRSVVNAHRPLLPAHNLELILSIQVSRVLSKNLSCQYDNIVYQVQTKRSAYALRGKTVLIREDLAGQITLWDKAQQLDYTIMKYQPKQEVADSKRVHEIMNILTINQRVPQTPWETPLSEMTEQIFI